MSAEDILNRYIEAGYVQASELYVDRETAVKLIRDATDQRVVVVGIEAFVREPKGLRPLLDQIADYSSAIENGCDYECLRSCNQSALEFVNQLPDEPGLVMAFVLEDT